MGRKINLIKEDSVNPQTASTKAERMIERDKVAAIVGEISSASCLTIAQVAQRTKNLFVNTGGNSDALRGTNCNRYMFHVESQNSMYVKTCGHSLLSQGLVKDKKWFSLTADYAFGHDLLRVAKLFMEGNGGKFAADKLVPTDATDFSRAAAGDPQRQARPGDLQPGGQPDHQLPQAVFRVRPELSRGRLRLRHRRGLGRRQRQLLGNMAARLAPPARNAGKQEVRRRLHEEVRQAAGEPGLGRLQRRPDHCPHDAGHQVDRGAKDHRALGERRQVRRDEDARGLLPRRRPPDDARDVHRDRRCRRRRSGTSGTSSRRRGRCPRPTSRWRPFRRRPKRTAASSPPERRAMQFVRRAMEHA